MKNDVACVYGAERAGAAETWLLAVARCPGVRQGEGDGDRFAGA
jgi:hypothetical protein